MNKIIGHIKWESKTVLLAKRIYLFCFDEKCMSGRITDLKELPSTNQFEIRVNFIEPKYFEKEMIRGNYFTVREASKILGQGSIMEVVNSLP